MKCPVCKDDRLQHETLESNMPAYKCGHCNGVWLDKGEWDILAARNLLGKINQFFTKPWQTSVQEEEAKVELDKLYTEKFGVADYARIKDIWSWLKDHPQRSMLLAYLHAENPYKV
jgi:Zn-finger nucleic acid-binding protein